MIGIGYQEYKQLRMLEGLTASEIELPGNERFLVYFGRAHVQDHETKVTSRGHLKIGRGKFATAIQRGRNQPGVDFRIYGEIIFNCNRATEVAEAIIADALANYNMKFDQGQTEMYNINDSDLLYVIKTVSNIVVAETSYPILEVNLYQNNKPTRIEIDQPNLTKSTNVNVVKKYSHFHSLFE